MEELVKNLPASARDTREMGLIPGSGRSSREGNGNPLQYSCLRNPVDRGAWWATVHGGCKESDTTERHTDRHTDISHSRAGPTLRSHFNLITSLKILSPNTVLC